MLRLRTRVAVAFGVLSLVVSMVVALSLYAFARSYLVGQREYAALTRALLDARAVDAGLASGAAAGEVLAEIPAVGTSQALVNRGGEWFARGVTLTPGDLPAPLLDQARSSGGALQWFTSGNQPFIGVAVQVDDGMYLELFPVDDLDAGLRSAGWLLAGLGLVAFVVGSSVGFYSGARLLRPLREMSRGARELARGDLSVRLADSSDPDLTPICEAFNDMADAVQSRISRERRFVANAAHELRSPVTTVRGTAELLEGHRDRMSPVDAQLVTSLATQARRMSSTLVDLLELGSADARRLAELESTHLEVLVAAILAGRNLPESLLVGDHAVVQTEPRRVERILGNLVDNAVRYGDGPTRVLIERRPDVVLVHVDDAGPGLDGVDIERLFEPFVRGSANAPGAPEGAGLGLAIATEHARALGASIQAGRSPDGGARFTLTLPQAGR